MKLATICLQFIGTFTLCK